jgi:hypothetical protein
VNTYTRAASTGTLFLTANQVGLHQVQTQAGAGGMTDLYKAGGTYLKSFYSVMMQPSSVKVWWLKGQRNGRWHHRVVWRKTAPKILHESLRRGIRTRKAKG